MLFEGFIIFYYKVNMGLLKRGKVRDVYDNEDGTLRIEATNRISAFDAIMHDEIPHKGEALNRIAVYVFDFLHDHKVRTHFMGLEEHMDKVNYMTCIKAIPIPVEFIWRYYLYGSALKNYKNGSLVIPGDVIPDEPVKAAKLKKPWFTPTTKEEKDIPLVGDFKTNYLKANGISGPVFALRELKSHEASEWVRKLYESRGIILCDHKLELGYNQDGEIIVIAEAGTPDSSRLWDRDDYKIGETIPSLDKQILRDWLLEQGFEGEGKPPVLPQELIDKISEKYIELYERLTGSTF